MRVLTKGITTYQDTRNNLLTSLSGSLEFVTVKVSSSCQMGLTDLFFTLVFSFCRIKQNIVQIRTVYLQSNSKEQCKNARQMERKDGTTHTFLPSRRTTYGSLPLASRQARLIPRTTRTFKRPANPSIIESSVAQVLWIENEYYITKKRDNCGTKKCLIQ